jgi:hypothetical protein
MRGSPTMPGTGYLTIGVFAFVVGVMILAMEASCTVPH